MSLLSFNGNMHVSLFSCIIVTLVITEQTPCWRIMGTTSRAKKCSFAGSSREKERTHHAQLMITSNTLTASQQSPIKFSVRSAQ